MGSTVLFLLFSNHDVSFADNESASLIVGLSAGQATEAGAYPPEGELGRARLTAAIGRAIASGANTSSGASRGITIEFAAETSKSVRKVRGADFTYLHIEQGM